MSRRILGLPALLLSFVIACGGGDDPEPTPTPTETPVQSVSAAEDPSLAAHVQATFQKEFVPDCAAADAAADAGKICATPRGERENMRAFTLGQVGSNSPLQWVIMQQAGTQWQVASTLTIDADNAAVPGVPWPLRAGVDVVVTGTGSGLNVRTGPGLSAEAVDRVDDGTVIRLSAGPADADGLKWWQIEGRAGWVVADYLRYPDQANPPAATPTPEATETPRP